MPLHVKRSLLAAHKLGELVVNNLNHQFLRLKGIDDILTYSLLLHGVGEGFSHFIVHVGFDKGATHLF